MSENDAAQYRMTHLSGGDLKPGWYLEKAGADPNEIEWVRGPGTVQDVRANLRKELGDTNEPGVSKVLDKGLDEHVQEACRAYLDNAQQAKGRDESPGAAYEAATSRKHLQALSEATERVQEARGQLAANVREVLRVELDREGKPKNEPPPGVEFRVEFQSWTDELKINTSRPIDVVVRNDEPLEEVAVVLNSAHAGNIRVTGKRDGNAMRIGSGPGDATREGAGKGNAVRGEDGSGNAIRNGDGDGRAYRSGSGEGSAVRSGRGNGDAVRMGTGAGNALVDGRGRGDARVGAQAQGDAIRTGRGYGDAKVHEDATGNAVRAGSGDGYAKVEGNARGDAVVEGDSTGWACNESTEAGDAINRSTAPGAATREGYGDGNAVRMGTGSGNATREGEGDGHAWRAGSGRGNADNYTSGDGQAVRTGMGTGGAERNGRGGEIRYLDRPEMPGVGAELHKLADQYGIQDTGWGDPAKKMARTAGGTPSTPAREISARAAGEIPAPAQAPPRAASHGSDEAYNGQERTSGAARA